MLAAGFAALAAAVATWTVADTVRHEWIASLLAFAVVFAFSLVASAVGAILLMPTAELSKPIRRGEPDDAPALLALVLVALAAAAVLQLPLVMSLWAQDRALIDPIGGRPDPLGLDIVPAAILFSIPSLATAALATCVLASLIGISGRAGLLVNVLTSCAAMQTGLVASVHLLLREFRETGTRLLMLVGDERNPELSAQVAEWFAAHDAIAAPVGGRLLWILGGSLAAVAISEVLAARRQPGMVAGSPVEASSSEPVRTVPPSLPQPVSVSSASSAFDYSNYCIKPRRTFLQSLVLRWYPEYDIQTIPPMSRTRFSFSWKTGTIRREPGGPDLVTLEPAERQNRVGARSYVVIDAVSGRLLGKLVPNWSAWEIVGPPGDSIGRVEKETGTAGFASYVAIVNEEIVCRFTWGMPGYLAHSSELEVEFLRGTHARFDRAVMIALAPILEHKARMASERAIARQSS